jgi:hypothetical protein
MARNQLNSILQDPDKGITRTHGVGGVLPRLFRQILADRNIKFPQWGILMHDFLTDARNDPPKNKKDQTSMRGNLTKEFTRPQMTWKVFCKALRFLKVVKIDIAIRAYYEDGRESVHSTSVNFGTRQEIPNFLDELERPDNDTEESTSEHDDNIEYDDYGVPRAVVPNTPPTGQAPPDPIIEKPKK